jgi:hypothetical protein
MKRFSIHMQFPGDERKEFVDVKPDKAKFSMLNFFNDIRAMDTEGTEPTDHITSDTMVSQTEAKDDMIDGIPKNALSFTTMTLRRK